MKHTAIIFLLFGIIVTLATIVGCNVDSANNLIRQVSVNIAGIYRSPNGGRIVENNSGAQITKLDVRQAGDQLEVIDNNNQIFRGTLSDNGQNFSFNLEGRTTAGNEVIMSGAFSISDGSSTMSGTWIEETLYSSFLATAAIASTPNPPQTNDVLNPLNWQGCCSDHNGVRVNSSGSVVVNSAGFAECNDGTSSPSCNVNNRN